MKLEDQVCSLELAKKLKELGVKQESIFWWKLVELDVGTFTNEGKLELSDNNVPSIVDKISAFTVAELGEMLPNYIVSFSGLIENIYECFDIRKYAENLAHGTPFYSTRDKTEANARAKMLIYLLENGLVKI